MVAFGYTGKCNSENCVVPVDRYGSGSIMLWAGASLHTKTQLVFIQ